MTEQRNNHFRVQGRSVTGAPYHYTESGLNNVYLSNGFTTEALDGEDYVSVENIEGLWKAIGLHLVMHQKTLAPEEIKFLRRQMDMTQAELGAFLRVSDQTVARWEKGRVADGMPGPADVALRIAFLSSPVAQPEGGDLLRELHRMVEDLVGRDEPHSPAACFEQDSGGQWAEKIAA